MKTWKLAATLTMSVTMIIAGAVFAQAGHRYNKGVYYDYYERPGTVYYYETVRQPRVKRHHKRFVRDRLWRHGDRDRFVYKKYRKYRHPRVFARPWRDVTPSSSLYIGLRLW